MRACKRRKAQGQRLTQAHIVVRGEARVPRSVADGGHFVYVCKVTKRLDSSDWRSLPRAIGLICCCALKITLLPTVQLHLFVTGMEAGPPVTTASLPLSVKLRAAVCAPARAGAESEQRNEERSGNVMQSEPLRQWPCARSAHCLVNRWGARLEGTADSRWPSEQWQDRADWAVVPPSTRSPCTPDTPDGPARCPRRGACSCWLAIPQGTPQPGPAAVAAAAAVKADKRRSLQTR